MTPVTGSKDGKSSYVYLRGVTMELSQTGDCSVPHESCMMDGDITVCNTSSDILHLDRYLTGHSTSQKGTQTFEILMQAQLDNRWNDEKGVHWPYEGFMLTGIQDIKKGIC